MIEQIRCDFANNSEEIKKELEQLLIKYKVILSKSMYEYLKSLLNCEFSAVANIISDEEKEALCNLYIYRAISMYNIYNRSFKLLKENCSFKLIKDEMKFETVNIYANSGDITINALRFQRLEKVQQIGNINLFLTKWSPEIREQEFARLFAEYERLSKTNCPYIFKNNHRGGPAAHWNYSNNQRLANLEKLLIELDNREELSDRQKKGIEIEQICFDLLTKDMELNLSDFNAVEEAPIESILKYGYDDPMEKKLVKKLPGLTITANIKHL